MTGRPMVAKVDGQKYEIPEIWVAGFCQANRCGVAEAVRFWAFQEQLAALEEQGEAS